MHRRAFLIRGGWLISVLAGQGVARTAPRLERRVGLGTVTFRDRFAQTRPRELAATDAALTLLEVPAYYRQRFAVSQLEFWSKHFESLDDAYLSTLRRRVRSAGCELLNIQVDEAYDLASTNEDERQRSLALVRRWIDAAARVRSRAIRINPGRTGGSVEQSIASLREVDRHCQSRRLKLLTENHFGLEMDPDVHLRILQGVGSDNVFTEPDFGNYPVETMWSSLEKILPHAYMVSAKAVDFDAQGMHSSYDFDRCIQLCERSGFKGVYIVEQWSRRSQVIDAEKIADWMLRRVRENL